MPQETGGRESILDEASNLFSQKGYAGVSIRDIAHACGMTNAALYYHFKNKEDLFLAVLRLGHEHVTASLAQAVTSGDDVRADLRRAVAGYADVMCAQRQSFQTLRRDVSHLDDARAGKLFGEMRAGFMRPLQQLVEAAQSKGQIAAGDARLLARLLHGMIIALTHERQSGRQTPPAQEEVDELVAVFLDGVGRQV